MDFQITDIEFDFDDAFDVDPLTDAEIEAIYDDHIGMIVEAESEDEMIEEITCTTGWCVKSINYVVLK